MLWDKEDKKPINKLHEVKVVPLFADDIIIYAENPKDKEKKTVRTNKVFNVIL